MSCLAPGLIKPLRALRQRIGQRFLACGRVRVAVIRGFTALAGTLAFEETPLTA